MKEWAERVLVAASRRGDRAAYAELVRQHCPQMLALCLGMLADRDQAEQAAQQVLLRGFREIRRFPDGQRFGAWIARLGRDWCLPACIAAAGRRGAGRRRLTQQQAGINLTANLQPSEYPELQAALSRLDEQQRVYLLLYYFGARSAKTVAEALGVNEAEVYVWLRSARNRLRQLLAGQDS